MAVVKHAGTPDDVQAIQPIAIAGAMLTEVGLLLAGVAHDAPLAAAANIPEPGPLLRFDRPEQGGLLFVEPEATARFVAWMPAAFVPDLPAFELRLVARSGRVHLLNVSPASYRTYAAQGLPALYAQFTPLIDNMIDLTQPPGHPLRAVVRVLAEAMSEAAARPQTTGAFDFIADDVAHGWAWNPRAPQARQLVEIVDAAGTIVARGHAEHYRPDLEGAGIGDGNHHFRITLPLSLRDGERHRLSARVPEGDVVLPGGPHDYRSTPASLDWFDLMPAAAILERVARLQSGDAAVAVLQVHALIDNGQPERGHDAALALIAEHGESGVACVKLGEALLLTHRTEEAARAFTRARAADPDCPYASLGLGNSHARRGEWTEAERAYRAGLALGKPCAPLAARHGQVRLRAFNGNMLALIRAGRPDAAVAPLVDHLFAHPEDEDACALLEQALHAQADASAGAEARRLRVFELLIGEAARRKGRTAA